MLVGTQRNISDESQWLRRQRSCAERADNGNCRAQKALESDQSCHNRLHMRCRTGKSHGKYLRYIAWNASVCLNCFKARENASTKEDETRAVLKQTYIPSSITLRD